MNERIKELADSSNLYDGCHSGVGHIEKFAWSIIRECLEIVNRKEYSYHEADPLWETAEFIKQRFGVEE